MIVECPRIVLRLRQDPLNDWILHDARHLGITHRSLECLFFRLASALIVQCRSDLLDLALDLGGVFVLCICVRCLVRGKETTLRGKGLK